MPPKQQSETESPLYSRESTPREPCSRSQHQAHHEEEIITREDLEHLCTSEGSYSIRRSRS